MKSSKKGKRNLLRHFFPLLLGALALGLFAGGIGILVNGSEDSNETIRRLNNETHSNAGKDVPDANVSHTAW